LFFFFSSRRRHTRSKRDWSSDVCSSDLDHLRRAGFVSGNGVQQPLNAVTGQIGVQTGNGASPALPVLGTNAAGANGFSGLIICSANLPDKIASAVDTQMDDGQRVSGTVRGQLQTGPNPTILQDANVAGGNYQE